MCQAHLPRPWRATTAHQPGFTHRITLGARHLFESSGLFIRINGFADGALNNYPINVDATNERGNLYPVTVKRFHDAYQAAGVNAEVGLVNQSWARRLVLRTFASGHRREFQHNFSMTVPFGGASYRQRTVGANLRYEHTLGDNIALNAVAGVTRSRGHFLDIDPCVYDWLGECILVGRTDGETDILPHDSLTWDNSVFARLNLEWFPLLDHAFRASVAPTFVARTGEERRLRTPEARDPLSAKRELFTLINGIEYEVNLFEDRFENILFGKQYTQILSSEISRDNNNFLLYEGRYRRKDRSSVRFGWGDSLR